MQKKPFMSIFTVYGNKLGLLGLVDFSKEAQGIQGVIIQTASDLCEKQATSTECPLWFHWC